MPPLSLINKFFTFVFASYAILTHQHETEAKLFANGETRAPHPIKEQYQSYQRAISHHRNKNARSDKLHETVEAPYAIRGTNRSEYRFRPPARMSVTIYDERLDFTARIVALFTGSYGSYTARC